MGHVPFPEPLRDGRQAAASATCTFSAAGDHPVTVQVDGVGTVELDFDDQNPRI